MVPNAFAGQWQGQVMVRQPHGLCGVVGSAARVGSRPARHPASKDVSNALTRQSRLQRGALDDMFGARHWRSLMTPAGRAAAE